MFVPAYFASQSFVLFYLWYSSCFNDKCRFHTFPKRCSHISMGVLILLGHQECHPNSIPNRCVSLEDDPIILPIRKINSKLFSTVFIPSVTSCLCFPTLPPFFLKHSEVLTKYPFYSREVPSFFSINVLTRWFS